MLGEEEKQFREEGSGEEGAAVEPEEQRILGKSQGTASPSPQNHESLVDEVWGYLRRRQRSSECHPSTAGEEHCGPGGIGGMEVVGEGGWQPLG